MHVNGRPATSSLQRLATLWGPSTRGSCVGTWHVEPDASPPCPRSSVIGVTFIECAASCMALPLVMSDAAKRRLPDTNQRETEVAPAKPVCVWGLAASGAGAGPPTPHRSPTQSVVSTSCRVTSNVHGQHLRGRGDVVENHPPPGLGEDATGAARSLRGIRRCRRRRWLGPTRCGRPASTGTAPWPRRRSRSPCGAARSGSGTAPAWHRS
jgi:hypothetical protein